MSSLNPTQTEQLKEIGAHLRQRRQALSIPIEEVASKTLIRLALLKALEEGQSDQLPEPVFVQGFIRRYGDAVGMDGTALAKTFPINSPSVESETALASKELPPSRDGSLNGFLPIALLILAATAGLFYLLNRPKVEPAIQSRNSTEQQKTAPSSELPAPASPTPAVAKPEPQKPNVPLQVTVNLQEESWLRVIADGNTQFEGLLQKGKQQTWTAKKQLTVRAGNAGGVLLSRNQEKPKLLGGRGDVQEVTFTQE